MCFYFNYFIFVSFVSCIEFIRSKLLICSAHVSGVSVTVQRSDLNPRQSRSHPVQL